MKGTGREPEALRAAAEERRKWWETANILLDDDGRRNERARSKRGRKKGGGARRRPEPKIAPILDDDGNVLFPRPGTKLKGRGGDRDALDYSVWDTWVRVASGVASPGVDTADVEIEPVAAAQSAQRSFSHQAIS